MIHAEIIFNITILLVHHTRKTESSDAFNMISGTTGLLGCADGALVLQKPSLLSFLFDRRAWEDT